MNEALARSLWDMGAGHALGAEAVVLRAKAWAREFEDEDQVKLVFNGKYSASIYLLLGYGFELLLKSAYLARGGDPQQLNGRRGMGHDLRAALSAAEQRGFQSSAPHLRAIVELLHVPHLSHQFRYGGMNEFPVPANVDQVVANLNHLASEIHAILYPDGP